ncbi:MAG: hypothetical protein H6R36_349 [Chloroflexi bacterium]|nr:hypothetical protein [Chloroflexota bacterium]
MQTLKRVVAVIVIALSIIGIIVCVGGILGAWTISSALSNAATRVLTLAESPLNTASQGTATVANSVGSIRETLALAASAKRWPRSIKRSPAWAIKSPATIL